MHLYEDYAKMNPEPAPAAAPTPSGVSLADVEAMKNALTENFNSKLAAMQSKLDEFMKANNIKPLADNEVGIIQPDKGEPSGNNDDSKGE